MRNGQPAVAPARHLLGHEHVTLGRLLTGGPIVGVKREDGGLRQAVSHQAAQPGHYPGHALGRLTGPRLLFCRHCDQQVSRQRRREGQGVAAVRGGRKVEGFALEGAVVRRTYTRQVCSSSSATDW